MANRELHAWAFCAMVRSCVTAGYILGLCARSAHVAARDAYDGGAAPDFAGRAAHSAGARNAPVCRSRVCRASPELAAGRADWAGTDESRRRFVADGSSDAWLARTGAIRTRATVECVAPRGTRVFFLRIHHVLVAGSSALAQPRAMAALGHGPLPRNCRSAEHRVVGRAG